MFLANNNTYILYIIGGEGIKHYVHITEYIVRINNNRIMHPEHTYNWSIAVGALYHQLPKYMIYSYQI